MFSLNYPPSFLRSVRDEPYIFKFLWSGLFLYHIEILQVINETYHGVQVINFTNPIILYFHQYFNLGISCIVSTPFMNNFIVFSFLCAISANTNINHKYSI